MKTYKTLTEWLLDICNSINSLIERVNTIYSVPTGGTKGQVLTKSGPENYDLEWKDQEAEAANGIPGGGTTGQILAKKSAADYDAEWIDNAGGTGDVTAEGDNVFSGKNTFARPIIIGEGSAPDNAARVSQVTELGDEVNAVAGASVTKDNAQTITGVKTFTASPKVPTPTAQGDATPKSYVDTEIDTAASETLTEAKAYTDGSKDKIKDAVIAEIEQSDNVFMGTNVFDKPVSVGTPVGENDATTKKYVDDINTETATNITQLTENQTALQEDVQELQNGVINALTATGTAGQVWTKNSGYGEWKDPTGGGSGSDDIWKPTVSEAGEISWEKSTSTTPPATQNIRGPKGEQGDKGGTGDTGPQGPAGEGVPAGGTTGQVLAKKTATDYDTEWVDQQAGGDIHGIPAGGASGSVLYKKSKADYDATWGPIGGTSATLMYNIRARLLSSNGRTIGETYSSSKPMFQRLISIAGGSNRTYLMCSLGGGSEASESIAIPAVSSGVNVIYLAFVNPNPMSIFVSGEVKVTLQLTNAGQKEIYFASASQNAVYASRNSSLVLMAYLNVSSADTIESFVVDYKDVLAMA